MTSHAVWSLAAGTFVASLVEFVEALTIVLAIGLTRGWRSARPAQRSRRWSWPG